MLKIFGPQKGGEGSQRFELREILNSNVYFIFYLSLILIINSITNLPYGLNNSITYIKFSIDGIIKFSQLKFYKFFLNSFY